MHSKILAFLVALNMITLIPLLILYFYAFYYVSITDIHVTPSLIYHRIPVVGIDAQKYDNLNLSYMEEDPFVPAWLDSLQYEYMLKFIMTSILILINIILIGEDEDPNHYYIGKLREILIWAVPHLPAANSTVGALYKLIVLQLLKITIATFQLASLWIVSSYVLSKNSDEKGYNHFILPYLLSLIAQAILYEHETEIIPLTFYLSPLLYTLALLFIGYDRKDQTSIFTLYFTVAYGESLPDFNLKFPLIPWVGTIISVTLVLLANRTKSRGKTDSTNEGLRAARAIERLIMDVEEALH